MDRPKDRLALIELIDRDGRVRRSLDVHAWPLTIGRALDMRLVLDDPHVAPHHATLAPDDQGRLWLQVGDTANGVGLGRRQLAAHARSALPADGALLQIGGLRLRLRLRGETLADERLLSLPVLGGAALAAVAASWALLQAAERWLLLDPGADFVQWLPWLLGLPVAVALWCGAWALGSKLFRHGFDFAGHAAIALLGLLAWTVSSWLLPALAAAADWPLLWQLQKLLLAPLLAGLVLRAHLLLLLPLRGRAISTSLVLVLAAGVAVDLAVNQRQHGQPFADPYMRTLPPPLLRWGSVQPTSSIGEAMAPLRETLADWVRQDAIAHPDGGAEGDEP